MARGGGEPACFLLPGTCLQSLPLIYEKKSPPRYFLAVWVLIFSSLLPARPLLFSPPPPLLTQ